MAQSIFGLGMGGSGIVAVLIIAGILLNGLNVNEVAGQVAIWGGVCIGLFLGILGVFGVVSRYV